MLIQQENYIDIIERFSEVHPDFLVERIEEKIEEYIGIEATFAIGVEQKIDIVDKYILKIIASPIKQPKTLAFIDETLNIGSDFVTAYIDRLENQQAIIKSNLEYAITPTGQQILEEGVFTIDEKEHFYQFIYHPTTERIYPWQITSKLVAYEECTKLSNETLLNLMGEISDENLDNLHIKQAKQTIYQAVGLLDFIATNKKNYRREKFTLDADGQILKRMAIESEEEQISAFEQQFATTARSSIAVHEAFVDWKISQVSQSLTIIQQTLALENLSVQELTRIRKWRCPVTIYYGQSTKVLDRTKKRDLAQYYMMYSAGKRPLYLIQHPMPFDGIIIDETELLYQENGQWYYHANYANWDLALMNRKKILQQNLLNEKDETIWYPLLEAYVSEATEHEVLALIQAVCDTKAINFAHRLEKLLHKNNMATDTHTLALEQWKIDYYAQKQRSSKVMLNK